MSRAFFRDELETVATYWRILRTDGVALGFVTHDRDLWFDGLLHRSAPALIPSSVRLTTELADDGLDIEGALSHDTIRAQDVANGRFDGATIAIGAVDWENFDTIALYIGTIGTLSSDAGAFTAEIRSAKSILDIDPVPRSSPTCRARFCGPGCNLPPRAFEHESIVTAIDRDGNSVMVTAGSVERFRFGSLRWADGPHTGQRSAIADVSGGWLRLDRSIGADAEAGSRIILREGCDHELSTCRDRFDNVVNFQGEPFLPGNDFLSQVPAAR